ncbi:sulfatase-like hydrolase/transferase [Providencia rustigianii]|uniref:LTA synthase family protein n=1 Tax=Providencia rustigianii TaxID=158850 RepID=UPI000F71ECE9|nr:LTA synthase family protein [Providencia rustigianii]MTC59915.1 sulfatase-like hydrolase/transferase [Providencia rustigianii]VEH57173.1 Phosphoglycerol transferase and related proteins, alkaline phosphatase superfamily [Providencia rustigianii]
MNKKIIASIYLALIFIGSLFLVFEKSSVIYPALISVSVFAIIFGVLFTLTARWLFSAIVTSTLFIIIKIFNQLKVHYYKEQLFFTDINLMTDTSNLGTLGHYWLAGLAVIGLFIVLIINGIISWRLSTPCKRWISRVVSILMVVAGYFGADWASAHYYDRWSQTLPKGRGTVTNLVMSANNAKYKSPHFVGDSSYFEKKAADVVLNNQGESEKPDIVLLLQESSVDPKVYDLPEGVKLPELFMFQQDANVVAHSPMRVQTFGGGTWLSEFSALTGLNSDDFGSQKSGVFYFVVDHLNHGLFKEMKANGYYTVVLTPFNKGAYHSGHAYETLGVDRIIQPQELGYPGKLQDNLWTISTEDMLKYVKKILEKETDKPVFIFSLTMYEHGPYKEGHSDDYGIKDKLDNKEAAGEFSHYMEKIVHSDASIRDFVSFMEKRQRPLMFLYFGDHQPGISLNQYKSTFPTPAYLTQFTLRDNLKAATPINVGELTDISFLGGILLERANLKISPFYEANIKMRHLCDGKLNDCEDKQLLDGYRHYIYNVLNVANKDAAK